MCRNWYLVVFDKVDFTVYYVNDEPVTKQEAKTAGILENDPNSAYLVTDDRRGAEVDGLLPDSLKDEYLEPSISVYDQDCPHCGQGCDTDSDYLGVTYGINDRKTGTRHLCSNSGCKKLYFLSKGACPTVFKTNMELRSKP